MKNTSKKTKNGKLNFEKRRISTLNKKDLSAIYGGNFQKLDLPNTVATTQTASTYIIDDGGYTSSMTR